MLARGTILAGYRLDDVLGKGGMGVVYEATQLSLNRTVALKVLAPHLSDDEAFRQRFRREGQIQAAIDHPNIVTVHEAGETEHGLFIVMRLVRGATLKDLIVGRELDAARSLRILRQVADALDAAHEAGLIHRDVKPQNVLVAGKDHAYLADFGLTKAMGDTGLTRTGQFVGTVHYMAPEQIQGDTATGQSDVYALTAVLYECLTEVVPYPRDSDVAVLYAHMSEPPPKVSDQRPDLPEALDAVIAKGMAKEPGERFTTAGALMEAAERAFNQPVRADPAAPAPIEALEETVIADGETAAAPAAGASTVAAASPTVDARGVPTVLAGAAPTVDAPGVPAVPPRTPPAGAAPHHPSVAPRANRSPWVIAAVVAVVAVAVVGLLVGRSGSGGGSVAGADVAAAGPLRLSLPKEWSRSATPATIPGLTFEHQIAAAPAHPVDGEALVAGQVAAGGRLLLPTSFVRLLPAKPSSGDAVKLGDLQAYRYSGLAPTGLRERVTLYTVPASAGVATVACLSGPRTPSSFHAQCERVAGSLELPSGKHYTLGPSTPYASTLGVTILTLNASVESGQATLLAAGSPPAQASAAASLSGAFGRAAARLGKLELSPEDKGANAALVAALRSSSGHYSALAVAARRGDRPAYGRAETAIRSDQQATQRALAGLQLLGYSVR